MESAVKLFSPVKSKRTFEEVSDSIKELILNGTLKVGDRLPSETELAQQFSVGRQTIREALRLMELSGFITIQRGGGGGSIIKDTMLRRIGDLFADAFRMRSVTLGALTQARLEIERIVLEHVLSNADQADLNLLGENVAEAQRSVDAGRMASDHNFEFHILLARASKNEVFVIVVESIMAVHMELLSRVGADLETSRNVVRAHRELLRAIEDRDRLLALRLLEEHVLDVKRRLKDTASL
jgi:GntR family transcriptional repressor for pyruvate dehydrogenase complex